MPPAVCSPGHGILCGAWRLCVKKRRSQSASCTPRSPKTAKCVDSRPWRVTIMGVAAHPSCCSQVGTSSGHPTGDRSCRRGASEDVRRSPAPPASSTLLVIHGWPSDVVPYSLDDMIARSGWFAQPQPNGVRAAVFFVAAARNDALIRSRVFADPHVQWFRQRRTRQ